MPIPRRILIVEDDATLRTTLAEQLALEEDFTADEADSAGAADQVLLDADERHRRRAVLTGERGTTFLLDLPHATALRDGDGLLLDDGRMVRIVGRPEPLIEIAAAGKPAVLVPYPHATADHQAANARFMAAAGAAIIIPDAELTAPRLAQEVGQLLADRVRLAAMARASQALSRPGAAREVARELLDAACSPKHRAIRSQPSR